MATLWDSTLGADLQARISAALAAIAGLPLPLNAAQETGGNLDTLAAVDYATETTLGTLATEATQATLATEATVATLALESGGVLDDIYTRQGDGNQKTQVTVMPTVIPAHAYDTVDLTTAFAAGLLEADAGDSAVVVPSACFLSWLTLRVHTLTGAAAKITYYLAHDSDGIIPITEPLQITLSGYLSKTAGSYVIAESLEVQYERIGASGPYIIAKVDADTAKVVARLGWRLAR